MQKGSKVAVVGGSLAGPTTALALTRAGFDVTLYEAVPSAVSLVGGVIGLDHVSLDILEGLGIEQNEIIPFNSERVVSIRMRSAQTVKTIYPGRNTTWTKLHESLMKRLDCVVMTNHKVTGLDTFGNQARLHFAHGDSALCDFVVFADGRKSIGRKLLDPARKLHYAGYVANRGTRMGDLATLRDFTSYRGEGTQFNIFPIIGENGQICIDWTFYLNADKSNFEEMFGGKPTVRTFVFDRQIGELARTWVNDNASQRLTWPMADIVKATAVRAVAPIIDIDTPSKMVFDLGGPKAVLIGDALAPVRPHTAFGANAGIHQAHDLTVSLRQVIKYGADYDAALDAWQARNLPVVASTIERGKVLGKAMGLGC